MIRVWTVPISGDCCSGYPIHGAQWGVPASVGGARLLNAQLCWGREQGVAAAAKSLQSCPTLGYLPLLTWAHPDRSEAWNYSRGGDSSGSLLFHCWQDRGALAWVESTFTIAGSLSQQEVRPAGSRLERDPRSESFAGTFCFSVSLPYDTSSSVFRTHSSPGPGVFSSWKSLKCGKKKGVWGVCGEWWETTALGWMMDQLSVPSPFQVIGAFPPGRGGVGADANWVVTAGCLSLPGRPGDISPTIVIREKAFTRMII